MNTVGELKDIYTIAMHVGIAGARIERFLKTAEIAGYVLVRKEELQHSSAAPQRQSEDK